MEDVADHRRAQGADASEISRRKKRRRGSRFISGRPSSTQDNGKNGRRENGIAGKIFICNAKERPELLAAEDLAEEQNNKMEDAAEKGGAQARADVSKTTRRRKRKRRSRSSRGQNERRDTKIAGMIFMCNAMTKMDCFSYGVFGLPEQKKDIMEQVKRGMKLFLYDIDNKHLHGIFEAISGGGLNLVPEAFQESDCKFPAQVRFLIHKDCMPLAESDFKHAIQDNYIHGNIFRNELTFEQVGKLIHLFRPLDSNGFSQPIRHDRDARIEAGSQNAQRGSSQDQHTRPRQGAKHASPPDPARHVSATEPVYSWDSTSLYAQGEAGSQDGQRGSSQYQHAKDPARHASPPVPARDPPRQVFVREQPVYSWESTSSYAGEHHQPIDWDYYRTQRSYLPASQTAVADVEVVRRRYLTNFSQSQMNLDAQMLNAQTMLLLDPLERGAEY